MKSPEDVIVLASDQKSYSGAIEEGFRKLSTCQHPDKIEIKVTLLHFAVAYGVGTLMCLLQVAAGSYDVDCEVGEIKASVVDEEVFDLLYFVQKRSNWPPVSRVFS